VLALLLGLALQQEQPEKVFRFAVDVHTVYIDVFISRGGQPLAGLTADDFVVLDNGVAQEIDIVDPQMVHWSVILLLDTSASVSGERLEHLRAAAHAFVDGLTIDDEAALMTFAGLWQLRQGFTRDIAALHGALDRPVQGGFTGLNDALYAGLKLAGEGTGRPMILLFTDGADNASWLTAKELLKLVRESEAVVHVVGIKSSLQTTLSSGDGVTLRAPKLRDGLDLINASDYLEKIASSSGGRTWSADTSADLSETFMKVLQDMESRYFLSYQVQGTPRDGWHDLEVKLKKKEGAEIRARTGYALTQSRGVN
jgi:VWFA-related protein